MEILVSHASCRPIVTFFLVILASSSFFVSFPNKLAGLGKLHVTAHASVKRICISWQCFHAKALRAFEGPDVTLLGRDSWLTIRSKQVEKKTSGHTTTRTRRTNRLHCSVGKLKKGGDPTEQHQCHFSLRLSVCPFFIWCNHLHSSAS